MAELEISTRKWDLKALHSYYHFCVPSEHWKREFREGWISLSSSWGWETNICRTRGRHLVSPVQGLEMCSIPTRIWPLTLTIPGHLLVPSELLTFGETPLSYRLRNKPSLSMTSSPWLASKAALLSHPVYLRWTPSGRGSALRMDL